MCNGRRFRICLCLKICSPGKQREKCPGRGVGGGCEGSRTGQREAPSGNAQASREGGGEGEEGEGPQIPGQVWNWMTLLLSCLGARAFIDLLTSQGVGCSKGRGVTSD